MPITIASVFTADLLDKAYILLNSIKQNKKPETDVHYILFIKYTSNCNKAFCKKYLDDLVSDDFRISILSASTFEKNIYVKGVPYFLFIRCLLPNILLNCDKLIYLDVDVACVRPGIEALWNMPMDGLYVRAVIDPPVHWCPGCDEDYHNTRAVNYFNAGVLLMNLKKIKDDGLADVLEHWCANWDHEFLHCVHRDQTLLNYLMKDHVALIPFKWNNMVFGVSNVTLSSYERCLVRMEGYGSCLDSLRDAVFIHFVGPGKPWNDAELKRGEAVFPYLKQELAMWKQIEEKYGKRE